MAGKITFFKASAEDIRGMESLHSWAEVMNFHMDDVRQTDEFGAMYHCWRYRNEGDKTVIKLSEIVIADFNTGFVWVIHWDDGARDINSPDAKKLEQYAVSQWARLAHKYLG